VNRYLGVWKLVVGMSVSLCLTDSFCFSMTIREKLAQLDQREERVEANEELATIQQSLQEKKEKLRSLYQQLQSLLFPSGSFQEISPELLTQSKPLQEQVLATQRELAQLEKEWQAIVETHLDEEIEGLWHQPETTVAQLVIDYNVRDVVYVMPPEIASIKIHVSARLPVPRAAWDDMLHVTLASSGIGVKEISPFIRQLYFLRMNQCVSTITEDRAALDLLPVHEKVAFVCSPPTGELRRVFQFLERFAPHEQMTVQLVGGHLVIVGLVREVQDLLKIYDFVVAPQCMQQYRILSLRRADSKEVSEILSSIFEGDTSKMMGPANGDKSGPFFTSEASFGFRAIALTYPASSLFLMGKKEQLEKACKIVEDIEESIGGVQEKTIYWYACRHSEAEELAKVLSQVYTKLVDTALEIDTSTEKVAAKPDMMTMMQERIRAREHAQDSLIVDAPTVSLPSSSEKKVKISENFIVDPKTNSIILVVEAYLLPKLKELLKKLDVPKQMVKIDVLLFEKKISDSSSMGLTSLKVADAASNKAREKLSWSGAEDAKKKTTKGILDFFFSRKKGGWYPAYDFAYQFLLSQEDIQINASPSVTAVNQTQAKLAVVDQISINTGIVEVNREHVKDAYSRAEYGITIQLTPTIHAKVDEDSRTAEEPKYITLVADIIFDSTRPNKDDRPDVTRRNIKNEICVRDGETAVIGGLRRKLSSGSEHLIPFLGELPGIGKLFSTSSLSDSNTEMFIFLTPTILPDDREEWRKIQLAELAKRPGDIPELLHEVYEARQKEKRSMMEKSLRMLFGEVDVTSSS